MCSRAGPFPQTTFHKSKHQHTYFVEPALRPWHPVPDQPPLAMLNSVCKDDFRVIIILWQNLVQMMRRMASLTCNLASSSWCCSDRGSQTNYCSLKCTITKFYYSWERRYRTRIGRDMKGSYLAPAHILKMYQGCCAMAIENHWGARNWSCPVKWIHQSPALRGRKILEPKRWTNLRGYMPYIGEQTSVPCLMVVLVLEMAGVILGGQHRGCVVVVHKDLSHSVSSIRWRAKDLPLQVKMGLHHGKPKPTISCQQRVGWC